MNALAGSGHRRWRPPCGEVCRCRFIALSEQQTERLQRSEARRLRGDAQATRARATALERDPDPGRREFLVPCPEDLPELSAPHPRRSNARRGINIKGMYGGFGRLLKGDDKDLRLVAERWSRVVGFSSRRHEIRFTGIRLVAAGWA